MMLRFALLSALIVSPALAQEAPVAPPPPVAQPAPKPATVRVDLETSEGKVVLELEKERAPITTANFLRYVDQKRLNGVTFYRATKVQPGYGFIQGGVRNDPKRVLPPIKHEPTTQTGLTHSDGTISMARVTPGTASGDFFITVGDIPSMDADPKQPGDNAGFAAFGHVVEGMDIIRHILDEPTSPTEGTGVMKGQFLLAPVKIVSAHREAVGAQSTQSSPISR
jgi:peptidyl-prolyl cis-trans isomerase A (cyclophilin A)